MVRAMEEGLRERVERLKNERKELAQAKKAATVALAKEARRLRKIRATIGKLSESDLVACVQMKRDAVARAKAKAMAARPAQDD